MARTRKNPQDARIKDNETLLYVPLTDKATGNFNAVCGLHGLKNGSYARKAFAYIRKLNRDGKVLQLKLAAAAIDAPYAETFMRALWNLASLGLVEIKSVDAAPQKVQDWVQANRKAKAPVETDEAELVAVAA